MRILILLAALGLSGAGADALAAGPAAAIETGWTIEPSGHSAAPLQVQFTLSRRDGGNEWSHSSTTPLAALEGLTAAQLDSAAGATVAFRFGGDAGTFDCDGVARRGHGTGACRFEASRVFVAALARHGIDAPGDEQLIRLAIGGVGADYLAELERQGYRPGLDDLVRASNHGITLDYLRQMGRRGYRPGSLDALVRMRDHGVTPDFVDALVEAGYRGLGADEVVEMRDHGVTPDYISELGRYGLRGIASADLVRLRDHGVMPDFVGRVRRLGFAHASTDDLIRMRDNGVGADYLEGLVAAGYGDLTPDEVVRLRNHGVDANFIRRANAGGRRSVEELVRLRTGG
jgi:hypothetical protein